MKTRRRTKKRQKKTQRTKEHLSERKGQINAEAIRVADGERREREKSEEEKPPSPE